MALPDVGAAVRDLARPVFDALPEADQMDLLGVLASVPPGARELSLLTDEANRLVLPKLGWATVTAHGKLFTVHRTGSKTTWEDAVVAHALVDAGLAKGLIHHPRDAANLILTAAAISYWRVGILAQMGLKADDYRTVVGGQLRVVPA